MIIYMAGHEGRGIGLWAKAATYLLQDSGENTYQANRSLGLPDDCREVALTPTTLYRKLDEWGFDSIVIPHGLAWGTVNPQGADFLTQLDEYEERYQKLLEVYSGHGSSELFVDFERVGTTPSGELFCPPAVDSFTPCCQQAGVIARRRCVDSGEADCDAVAAAAVLLVLTTTGLAEMEVVPLSPPVKYLKFPPASTDSVFFSSNDGRAPPVNLNLHMLT